MPDEKELEKKIKVLEQQLSEKEKIIKDPSKRGYFALCKILYQQIEYLEQFDLKKQIAENPKEDKVYDRTKGIWEGLKTMIIDCRTLKQELGVSNEDEEKEVKKISRITPETMSDVLGNTAGKIN
jgi:transcriptional regulator with XRE-family HTH domain